MWQIRQFALDYGKCIFRRNDLAGLVGYCFLTPSAQFERCNDGNGLGLANTVELKYKDVTPSQFKKDYIY